MALTPEQLSILMRPLNPNRVQSRSQGGAKLSYLAGYDVRATLIRVFGFGGFSAEVLDTQIIDIRFPDENKPNKAQVSAMVTLKLTIPSLNAVYTESAASSQTGSQGVGDVADFAIKTAETDALKRAAVNLGTQFGMSLYNNGSTDEVVRHIVAPGQEFWNGQQQTPPSQEVQQLPQPGIAQEEPTAAPEDDGGPAVLEDQQQRSQQRHNDEMNTLRNKLGQQTGDTQ